MDCLTDHHCLTHSRRSFLVCSGALAFAPFLPGCNALFNLPVADVLRAFKGLVLPDIINHHRLLGPPTLALQASAQKLAQEDPVDHLIQADFLPPNPLSN